MENKDNDLTKDDLLECSSLIHLKIHELDSSLESLKITLQELEETRYKEDKTLKNAKELYETVLEEIASDSSISQERKEVLLSQVLNGRWFSRGLDEKYGNLSDFEK